MDTRSDLKTKLDAVWRDPPWRGVVAAECPGRPWFCSALVFGAELALALGGTPTDRYRVDPDTDERRQFVTPTGATIEVDFAEASVAVAGADYRCDVRMLPDRIAVDYHGNHGGEGVMALYLLDWLHDRGELPTSGKHLSGADVAILSDLRDGLVDDEPGAEATPA